MSDISKITLGQLKTALTQAKNYTDNEIASVTGVSKVEPEELDMPKVFFYGNALPTTKDNVNLTMDYISNTDKFTSYVKLKCQGTSSMSYAKKNFTVTMYSDEARGTALKKDFKGWGAQSKFCLKANYVDTTHTRNLAGARIGYDIVKSRPDSTFKQQLLSAPRCGLVDGFPIKLYFNGEFYGIYTWNIPKDGWMFNMDESNTNHIVLCAERNTDGNSSLSNSCQFKKLWTDGDGGDWSVEFGTYSTDLQTKFNRVIAFIKDSTDEEFKANISQYLDLYSVIDYYCFSYLCCHLDGLAKNMLMVTYDGNIWGCSLYDMDSIFGVNWNGNSYVATNYQCPEQYQEQFSLLWPKIERCFGNELYQRYLELRRGALSLSNIIKHVEEIYDVIPDRVFADEKAKWTSLPQVNTNTMTRFRNYMRDRAVYVDAQMKEMGTRVPCTGIVLSADALSFITTDTQTLSVVVSPTDCTDRVTWSVSPTGVVSVNNGVVTPIANGGCTITATCGTQTATCDVIVSGISEGGGDTGDYTDISYIESTGTQYINTHIVPTASTKIELVAEMSASKQYDHIFGSDNFMKAQWVDDTYTAIFAIKKNGQNQIGGLTLGKHTYIMDMTDTTNVITIDGTKYGTNIGHVESTTNPLLLLSGYKTDGTVETEFCGIGKIYSCKIYYEDTLVANMKPILTNSGTYGLLDTVNNTFYGSEVGSFTGPVPSSGGGSGVNDNLVFQIDSTSMNTADNTLTDNIAGISATLTGTPTIDNNNIKFNNNSQMLFDLQTLNLSDFTYRFKFTIDTLDNNPRNVMCVGAVGTSSAWDEAFTSYVTSSDFRSQYGLLGANNGLNKITGDTTGNLNSSNGTVIGALTANQEHEVVYSLSSSSKNIRVFLDGVLICTGTIAKVHSPNYLGNHEGSNRFIGGYSLIEVYNKYYDTYEEFTNSSSSGTVGGDTDVYATAEYAITEARTFNGTSDYIDTGLKLFDTAKTFTLFIDYTSTTAYETSNVMFHCIHEAAPYRGLCLMKHANSNLYFIGGQVNTKPNYATDMPSNGKYLISFVNGVINKIVTVDNSGNLVYSATDRGAENPYVQISENLLIGCYQELSGTKGRYWSGTINKFGVWYKQLTESEMNNLLKKNI